MGTPFTTTFYMIFYAFGGVPYSPVRLPHQQLFVAVRLC